MKKNQLLTGVLLVVAVIAVMVVVFFHKEKADKTTLSVQATVILLLATSLTLLLIILVTLLFGKSRLKNGIYDYFIGEQGTYSLSRVQAVIWAVVIIASQIACMIALLKNVNESMFYYYQPVFSSSSLWLLALSLSSYILVKGIIVDKMAKGQSSYKAKMDQPKWTDLLSGENGLDFSRCQMLIWTIIALFVFEYKCYYFIYHLMSDDIATAGKLFLNQYEEYAETPGALLSPKTPFVPYLPWTFVVLMGLSQGVYVGKKLVPTFKLDDVKAQKQQLLQHDVTQLSAKRTLLQQIIANAHPGTLTAKDKQYIASLQADIQRVEQQVVALQSDITEIDQFKK